MTKKQAFNAVVTGLMIGITFSGSMANGWLNLANLVSWAGLIGVILLAHGKQTNFWFNGINNAFSMILTWRHRLFAEVLMNAAYLVSEFIGYRNFKKNRRKDGSLIVDNHSNWKVILYSILVGFVLMGGFSWIMGGVFIIADSVQNSLAIVAQYRQMYRKRDSWLIWLAGNLINIFVWSAVGVPQMALTFVVFSLNSIRGYVNWSETETKVVVAE